MEERTKQRLVGVLVFVGALFIILPFLFHNARPSDRKTVVADATTSAVSMPTENTTTTSAPADDTSAPVAATTSAPNMSAPMPAGMPIDTSLPVVPAPAVAPPTVTTTTTTTTNTNANAAPGPTPPPPQGEQAFPSMMPATPQAPVVTPAAPVVTPAGSTSDNTNQPIANETKTADVKPTLLKKTAMARPASHAQGWTIQIGAFSEQSNAAHLIALLRAHHFRAYSHAVTREGHSMTLVFVGPERNVEHARMAQEHLRSDFKLNGQIKRYTQV